MAAMSTVLTEFSVNGDSRTYTQPAHTVLKPKVVVQKRKVPVGNQVMSESSVSVVDATEDADGNVLPQKILFFAMSRYPITGQQADVDAAKATFLDITGSDEFANMVNTQEPLA